MKNLVKLLIFVILLSFLAGCALTHRQPRRKKLAEPAAAATADRDSARTRSRREVLDCSQGRMAESNQLGLIFTDTQDWAAIEEAAKKEGKVVVYANSSKIAKAAEKWAENVS